MINLLWCQDAPAPGPGSAAEGVSGGRATSGLSRRAAAGAASSAVVDVAMASVEEAAAGDVRAAVAARANALKSLGYEDALKALLQAQRAGAAAGRNSAQQQQSPSAATGAAASPGGRGAHAGSVAAGMGGEVDTQDLIERVQTALQQLGVSER